MRAVLETLAGELRRLKAAGVKTVPVSDGSLNELRRLVASRREAGGGRLEAGNPQSEVSDQRSVTRGQRPETSDQRPEASGQKPEASSRRSEIGDQGSKTMGQGFGSARDQPVSTLRAPVSKGTLPSPPVVSLPAGEKTERWQALRELVLNHPVCRAHVRPGRQIVFGVGNLEAKIMFVGEAPGAEEEQQGEPFVGPAGQLLTRMIKAMGLERRDVYIGNIMNWRPEKPTRPGEAQVGNREPTPEEMAFCLPFLAAQIEVVAPALLVALGATAARGLLGAQAVKTLGEARGRWHEHRGRPLRVTYHPSYLLRKEADGRVSANRAKRAAWEDFLAVMERAGLPISDKQRSFFRE